MGNKQKAGARSEVQQVTLQRANYSKTVHIHTTWLQNLNIYFMRSTSNTKRTSENRHVGFAFTLLNMQVANTGAVLGLGQVS